MIRGEHICDLLCYDTIRYVMLHSLTLSYIIVWYGMVRFLILKYVTTDHITLVIKHLKKKNYLFR